MYVHVEYAVSLCLVVLDLIFGVYTLARDIRNVAHRAFFLFTLGIAGWVAGIVLFEATHWGPSITLALWGGEFVVLGFLFCAEVFPGGRAPRQRFFLWLIPWALVFIVTPFNFFIRSATVSVHGYLRPDNSPLFPWWACIMAAYLIWGFISLVAHYRRTQGIRRVQMRYFITGSAIFIGAGFLFDIALPSAGVFRFNLLWPVFSLAFIVMSAYAMFRHQFMETRTIISQAVLYVCLLGVMAATFFFVNVLLLKIVHSDDLSDGIAMLISAFVFLWLKSVFERVSDKIFFRKGYRYAAAIRELGPILAGTIDLDMLLSSIYGFLAKTIKVERAVFVLKDVNEPTAFSREGRVPASRFPIEVFNALMANFGFVAQQPIFFQEIEFFEKTQGESDRERYRALAEAATRAGIAAIVPLQAKEGAAAILFLGPKLSGDIFRQKDMELLAVLSHQAGMAIENARLYREIQVYTGALEARVEERTKEVKALYEAQSDFLVDVSHELKTPLAIFRGNFEMIEKEASSGMAPAVQAIGTTLAGMERLIGELLESARLKFSKNKFYIETVDVGELLEEVHDDCLVLGASKGIRILFTGENVRVSADRAKIKEVLLNLVSNALKHTPFGGKISLEGRHTERGVEISVADSGSGIPEEDIPRIFDRFYRIKGAPGEEGHGIGLDICRQIIEAHHGTISAESRAGKGATFIIVLPAADKV